MQLYGDQLRRDGLGRSWLKAMGDIPSSAAWFGVVTPRLGVTQRWSAVALIAGSALALAGMPIFHLQEDPVLEAVITGSIVVQGLAWVMLGLEVALRRRSVPASLA